MTLALRLVLAVPLLLALVPSAALAEKEEKLTPEQLVSHPEVQGAVEALDAWIESLIVYDDVPGISVGFVTDQTLLWERGYGHSNLETKRAADGDTIYSICSISKLFTAIGVMQLRDAGKLRLSDPVGEHLDWYSIQQAHEKSGPATVESLLTHSSGLPREAGAGYWSGDFSFPSRKRMIEILATQETLYPADTIFQYSNLALSLAGEVVQARSGKSFDDAIREGILDPLGLDDTRPSYPLELRGDQLAIGYTGIDRRRARLPVEPFDTKGVTPAAGFTSTVRDLARFASWQFRLLERGGDEVLAANTLREMHRVHWIDPDWETTWGIGFNVRREGKDTLVGHSGGCPGYITQFVLVPKKKVAAIALTNAGDGPAHAVAAATLKLLGGAIEKAKALPEKELPDYSVFVGNYTASPWGGERAIRQWGENLVAIGLPSDRLGDVTKLRHKEGSTFVRLTEAGEEREAWVFELGDDGVAQRLVVHGNPSVRIP